MKKRNFLPIILLAMTVVLSGCGGKLVVSTGTNGNEAFMIDDMRCPKSEALIYLSNYKNLYGRIGESDLFDGEFDDSIISGNVKKDALSHLTKVYALDIYARDNEMTLSGIDEERIKKAAENYYSSLSDEDKSFAGVTSKDEIVKMYENLRLAEKVNEKLMKSIDSEVSEDEARVVDCYLLFVTDKSLANDLKAQLNAGATYDRLLASYSEKDKTIVSFARGEKSKEVEDASFNLDNDQISDVVEADDGYYIIKCVNKYDEELSEANKNKILKKRKEKLMNDIYNEQADKYYSEINDKLWDKISVDDAKDTKTNSFFSTLENEF